MPDVCIVYGSKYKEQSSLWPISGGQLYNHAKGAGAEDWAGSKGLGTGAVDEDWGLEAGAQAGEF